MKRHGNLYKEIIRLENLQVAYEKARRGKTWQDKVKVIEKDRDRYIANLHEALERGEYKTSKYRLKTIYEPKQRVIYILPFYPDRIVQHAVMNILAPIWDKLFVSDSYACRDGKGQHAGSKRCMQFVRRNKYCLQCDISKFYPSINHKRLMEIIARKIKCRKTLNLLREIVESIGGEANVPIGNYTSQWFGNLYLNEIDQLMKHKYRVRDYIRYCDDFLLFGNDKAELNKLLDVIRDFTSNNLKLKLSKASLFPTSQGVDFLGYRHFPNGKILLRKSTAKRIRKRIKGLPYKIKHGLITLQSAESVVASAKGWMKWANTYHYRKSIGIDEVERRIKDAKVQ